MEFCKIYFLTKFDPESIRMNLHTSSAPFSNGTSVSNLLIMSNLLFFGFYWLRYAKRLCSFFWIRFYICELFAIYHWLKARTKKQKPNHKVSSHFFHLGAQWHCKTFTLSQTLLIKGILLQYLLYLVTYYEQIIVWIMLCFL